MSSNGQQPARRARGGGHPCREMRGRAAQFRLAAPARTRASVPAPRRRDDLGAEFVRNAIQRVFQ